MMGSYKEITLPFNTFYQALKRGDISLEEPPETEDSEWHVCWGPKPPELDFGRDDDFIRVMSANRFQALRTFKENIRVFRALQAGHTYA